jgi:hypothetical protein
MHTPVAAGCYRVRIANSAPRRIEESNNPNRILVNNQASQSLLDALAIVWQRMYHRHIEMSFE